MEINLTGFLLVTGCGALLCILWFFLSRRAEAGSGKSALLSLLILVLGTVLGIACARLVWVLCMISYHPPLFALSYDELSYYGGMAGVVLAVCLAAKLCGENVRKTLNAFAPMGALLAAAIRFAEYFLGDFGLGAWMEEGLFFPLTIEFNYGDFSEFYPAVFMLEGIFSLIAMILSLVHRDEKYRWIRTLFYLCLPQIIHESLRWVSISWRFVRSEQLFCFLLCEGVLIWYALRAEPKKLRSWVPALTGLLVCGVVIVAEFAKDGKIMPFGHMMSQWAIYGIVAAMLALMAFMEHKGHQRINA